MSHTPSTDQVRADYILCGAVPGSDAANESAAAFDRWLASVKAEAWEEGHKQGGPMHDVNFDDPDAHNRNPYREEEA